jgi:hypothetical protein
MGSGCQKPGRVPEANKSAGVQQNLLQLPYWAEFALKWVERGEARAVEPPIHRQKQEVGARNKAECLRREKVLMCNKTFGFAMAVLGGIRSGVGQKGRG